MGYDSTTFYFKLGGVRHHLATFLRPSRLDVFAFKDDEDSVLWKDTDDGRENE